MTTFNNTNVETGLDINLDTLPQKIDNNVEILREGVDESLGLLGGVLVELAVCGTISQDGNVMEAFRNLRAYCAISLEMIKRTAL
jgi:hypothetical protein